MVLIIFLLLTQVVYSRDYRLIQITDFKLAIELIKYNEGYTSKPYYDTDGKLTIGYGYKLNVQHGQFMSEPMATAKIKQDLSHRLKRMRSLIKVPVNNNQINALLSLAYNIGMGNFARSGLLRKLNKGNYNLNGEFMRWIYVNGIMYNSLIKRRRMEIKLFNKEELK